MSNTTSSFSNFTQSITQSRLSSTTATPSDQTLSNSTLHANGTFSVPGTSSEGSSLTSILSASGNANTSPGSTPRISAAIIGGVIGAAVTVIVLVTFIFFFLRCRRRTSQDNIDPFSPRYNTHSTWGKSRFRSSASHISRSLNGSNTSTGFMPSTKYRRMET